MFFVVLNFFKHFSVAITVLAEILTLKYIRPLHSSFVGLKFLNILFISAPENVYSDTNIPISRVLEAVILRRIHVDLVGQFVQ